MAVINKYFEARNDDKVCIIDDTYKNLALKEVITFESYDIIVKWQESEYSSTALNTLFTGVGHVRVNVAPFNSKNLMAISCDVADLSFATYVHDDILTIYIIRKGKGDDHNKKDAQYVAEHTKILHYVPSNLINRDEHYGLQVFNAEGNIVFNSSNRYLKVVDVISQDIDDLSDIDRSYASDIAVVPLSCRYTRSYNPQRITFWQHFFTITNHRRLVMKPEIINALPPYGMKVLTGYFYNTNLLVIKKD